MLIRQAEWENITVTVRVDPLFEPFNLAGLKLRNRFVMSPMTRNFSPGGIPGDNVAAYYRRRAKADVGLIVTEGIGIDHPAALGSGSMGEHDVPVLHGEAVQAWQRVVDGVRSEENTSELQSLMRISFAVLGLEKKKK